MPRGQPRVHDIYLVSKFYFLNVFYTLGKEAIPWALWICSKWVSLGSYSTKVLYEYDLESY